MLQLQSIGWSPFFQNAPEVSQFDFSEALDASGPLVVGRVSRHEKTQYSILTAQGERSAVLPGSWLYNSVDGQDRPAIGDWLLCETVPGGTTLRVLHLFERRSVLLRQAAGAEGLAQVLAANVDVVFLTASLNRDFNPRRLERCLAMAISGGVQAVVVLTKSDLCPDQELRETAVTAIRRLAPDVPTHFVSALTGEGLEDLACYFKGNKTVTFLGSSGVGKSTLTNALLGVELQATGAVRECDDRGRHTTSARSLILRTEGGLIIDTPGLREVSLWFGDSESPAGFADVTALAEACRFNDCQHGAEPGCAVQKALSLGLLEDERWANYCKLQRERAFLLRKVDREARRREKQRWAVIQRANREHCRRKYGRS